MKIHRLLPIRRPYQGFTLIELLIVIAIIGILAALSIGAFSMAMQASARDRTKTTLQGIVGALERYKEKNGEYPNPKNPTTTISVSGQSLRGGGALMLYQAITGDGYDQIDMPTPSPAPGNSSSSGGVDPSFSSWVINGDFIPKKDPNGSAYRSKLNATMVTSEGYWLMDGFGRPFQYDRAALPAAGGATPTPTTVNPTYDLWSYGNLGNSDTTDYSLNTKQDSTKTGTWIKNW